jgi:hypothetical protein
MKKFTLMALVAIFTLSFSLSAQDNPANKRQDGRRGASEMRWTAKERAENLAKQLDLTADKKAEVQALFENQDAQRAEQIAKHRGEREKVTQNREERRTEMQALRAKEIAENDAELEKIIGKEKMEQLKKYRADRQKEMSDTNRSGRRNR